MKRMELKEVSLLWKVLAGIESIGFLLSLIGYGGNYIVSAEGGGQYGHLGLWTLCDGRQDCFSTADVVLYHGGSKVWVDASRWMMSIAIFCQFLAILLTALALLREATQLTERIITGVAGFSVLNGLLGLAVAAGKGSSFMEYTLKTTHGVDWSFTLFIIGQFAFVVAALGHFWDSRRISRGQTSGAG